VKLTIVGPAYPLRGGIAHHVFWLSRELRERGHHVQVISFRRLYPRLLFPGSTTFDNSRLKLEAGAQAILTPLGPLTWAKAIRTVKEFKPDAVIIEWWNTFFAPMVGVLVRSLNRVGLNCTIECHNVFPHERRIVDRPLLKFALSRAASFITHSQADCRELLDVLGERSVTVSPLPILSEFSSQPTEKRHHRKILFFGNIREYKGLQVLLHAMPKVLARVDCQLVVAGEFYEPVEKYRRLVSELGIGKHVEMQDRYVSNEEVVELFRQAQVLVLPYMSATQSGVARIAHGNLLPIIASRTGGLSEVVEEGVTGLLFEPGNSDSLADCLVNYFTANSAEAFSTNIRLRTTGGSELADAVERLAKTSHTDSRAGHSGQA
jgi:glycosyltransferase involved in cell wall biosynthesis